MNGDLPALRVVVADDHLVFRDGLAMILRERGIEVVAEVSDGQGALEAAAAHQVDVVLMDLTMPGLGGIEATRQLVAGHPAVAVLVLTMSEDDDSLFAALRAGAHGYLLKEAAADDIARAVVTVARGEIVLPQNAQRFVRVGLDSCVSECSSVRSMGFSFVLGSVIRAFVQVVPGRSGRCPAHTGNCRGLSARTRWPGSLRGRRVIEGSEHTHSKLLMISTATP